MTLHPGRTGSQYYYNRGCRCDECREAKRLAHRRSRDRARAEGRGSYLRELAASRALKKTYVGTCRECGGPTRYNGHTKRVSDLCWECATKMRTHCKRGHPLTPENRAPSGGSEICRICRNAYRREYTYRKRREAGVPERGPYLSRRRSIQLSAEDEGKPAIGAESSERP